MVTVPIHQASSSVPPLSVPVIDLSPPKPISSLVQAPIVTTTTATTTTTLSIDKGPFKMEKFRETLVDGALGPERDRVFKDLTPKEKERFTKLNNDMRNTKMTMPKMKLNSKFMNNMLPEWGRFVISVKLNKGLKPSNMISCGQDSTFDDDVDEPPVQDLALNVDQVFQTNQCDAFDSDVYEAPTAHTMFMANLSLADAIYDEASPSYDSDILSEIQ
ncbi:hypothetical protein Tco_0776425 [Tanacetum coccineum]